MASPHSVGSVATIWNGDSITRFVSLAGAPGGGCAAEAPVCACGVFDSKTKDGEPGMTGAAVLLTVSAAAPDTAICNGASWFPLCVSAVSGASVRVSDLMVVGAMSAELNISRSGRIKRHGFESQEPGQRVS